MQSFYTSSGLLLLNWLSLLDLMHEVYHHIDSYILSTAMVLHKLSKYMCFEKFWKIYRSMFFFYAPFLKYIPLSHNFRNCAVVCAPATHSMLSHSYGLHHALLVPRQPSLFSKYTEGYFYSLFYHYFVSHLPGVSYSPAASWCFWCP
jgi:hypothetical protein